MFSRQIKPRFPLLSTRCALSERSIALAPPIEKSWPTAIRDETLSAESPLPTCPLQSSTVRVARKRKQSKENRCGHPERIADSKVASRNTSSPISPESTLSREAKLYSYFIISYALSLFRLLVRFHELVFRRGIPP